ncbi:MAG TPA: helix-turn-helix transcriptional regulator [Ktedonosporobacter sp.]|jgi:transcriptional regulator with XRE-family HTH domain|nr:helix-turn-helix transcriptional regulator [Ktedonosporobacter sp.]
MTPNRRLKQARELRGWSQAKVAEQLGTDATTVSRWERGLFSPTPYFREKLCALFGKNAAELGLLEGANQSQESNGNDSSLRSSASLLFQAGIEWQAKELHAGKITSPVPPSWPKRTDTFTYILQSATYDQQAHLLWGEAYVRALQGQHKEAQLLGEASLSAFESVNHLNATAIREWLDQRGLVPPTPPPPSGAPPLPVLPEQRKRAPSQILRAGGVSFALILIVIASLLLPGFSFNQFRLPALTSSTAHALSSMKQETPMRPLTGVASIATPTPVIVATPTPMISPALTPPTPSALTAEISPANLTPQDCILEALGYRCTLTLWLYGSGQGLFTWEASSSLAAQFNASKGTSMPGQPSQVIVYIRSSPGEKGQLIFTFTSSADTCTKSVTWQG